MASQVKRIGEFTSNTKVNALFDRFAESFTSCMLVAVVPASFFAAINAAARLNLNYS